MKRSGSLRWLSFACLALGLAMSCPARARSVAPPPVVVAVLGESGLNVLHEDFARPDLPRDAVRGMPPALSVSLPPKGPYPARLSQARSGLLGRLQPNRLYRITGTNVVGVVVPRATPGPGGALAQPSATVDLFANTQHGTGVASALAGAAHGTAPDVRIVMVLGVDEAAWKWVADQSWIDLVTTSFVEVPASGQSQPTDLVCPIEGQARRLVGRGAALFSANGNIAPEAALPPASLPEAFRVGGVQADGSPVLADVDHGITTNMTASRGYDTGELYSFPAAAGNAATGSQAFGGTSGATPRTAGRAARLVAWSRRLLHQVEPSPPGFLASGASVRDRPQRGPLADGSLTAMELEDVMRAAAEPYYGLGAAGFPIEGFGAFTAGAERQAMEMLAGRRAVPMRPEAAAAAAAQTARQALGAGRCN